MKLQDVIRVYNAGYASGHHETVEGGHVDILTCDMDSYHKEEVLTLMAELGIENPEARRRQRDELIEIAVNERKWRLEDSECGGPEIQESCNKFKDELLANVTP